MVRGVISLGVCLGLLALGPTPLTACAMLAGLPSDCAPPPPVSENCSAMLHGAPSTALSPGDASCCVINAPSPDALATAKPVPLPEAQAVALQARPETAQSPQIVGSSPNEVLLACPLERQARLCVFLI